jgi:hypothetical protein
VLRDATAAGAGVAAGTGGRIEQAELRVLGVVPELEHERIVPTDERGEKSPAIRAPPGLSIP